MLAITLRYVASDLHSGGMAGCTKFQPRSSATFPGSALSPVEPAELNRLQAISRAPTSETQCHKKPSCKDAYYTRA